MVRRETVEAAARGTGGPSARHRALTALTAAALASVAVVACFAPGLMSFDSFQQLEQGRTGALTDLHPPIMAWVWGAIDRLLPGPLGMLLLHALLFTGGLALLAGSALRSPWSVAAAILGVTLLPPVFVNLGTVWKDVGMAAALVAACGVMLAARSGRRPWLHAVALPLLFYATAVRHNAAAAVLPIALWLGTELGASLGWQRRWPRIVLGVAVAASLTLGAAAVDARLVQQRCYPVQTLLLYDLAGISVRAGADAVPPFVPREPGFDLAARYSPKWGAHPLYRWEAAAVIRPADANPRLGLIGDEADIQRLFDAWLAAVRAHPRAYLAHRWELACWQFGMHAGPVPYPYHDGVLDNTIGIGFEPSAVTQVMRALRDPLRDTVLFRGWFFVAALTVLMVVAWRRRGGLRGPTLAIATSGLLYALPQVFCSTACDFRLVWWSVVASALALVLSIARGAPAPRPAPSPEPAAAAPC